MLRRILLASAGAMALAGTAIAADLPIARPAAGLCAAGLQLDRLLCRLASSVTPGARTWLHVDS